jgi:hypothetical protein
MRKTEMQEVQYKICLVDSQILMSMEKRGHNVYFV